MVMPSSWQSLGEALRHLDAHALLDVVQDLLVAGFVADEEKTQAVVLQNLQGLARHVGLGVARPGDAELAELAGDRLGARQIVGEGVVVEEEFLRLRKGRQAIADLVDDVADAARPVAVAADRLRPQAEGAARFAAAPGVERDVGVLEIADEVVLHRQVALVDRRHEGQAVHVVHDRPILVVHDDAAGVAIRQALDAGPIAAFGDLLDGEVELVAGHEIDRRRLGQAGVRLHGDLGADQAGLEAGMGGLQGLDHPHVGRERGRRGVQHGEVVVARLGHHRVEADAVRRRVDQLRALDEGGRLRQPGRIPER